MNAQTHVERGPEAVLSDLDPQQREVALATRGPVCVLAGAGTGKTRAVAHRIGYAVATGVVRSDRVLAVTFTTRAAGELRGRLRRLAAAAVPDVGLERVQARTFHAAALRQLTHFWPSAVGGAPPAVIESKLGLLAEVARRTRRRLDPSDLRDIAAEIEWAKVTQVRPEEYPEAAGKADRAAPLPPEQMVAMFTGYEQLCGERHLVDFESVLELTAAILAEHPAVSGAVRERYRYFVVDEYQDVNPLQKLLLDQWAGDRDDVCVVGDPRQTIYSFAGASPSYLTRFGAQYPDATVVRLVRNYRSSPEVVALANRVFAVPGQALVAQGPRGPAPALTEYDDEPSEVTGVVRAVTELVAAGTPPGRIAVLVRTNAMTGGYEEALTEAGVPYQMRGAERFFDRSEVRQAVGLLKVAARSRAADVEAGDDAASQVRPVLTGLGLTSVAPAGRGRARDRWESLDALAALADDFFATSPGASLADLVAELEVRGAMGHAPDAGGLTLASLHAAKGLEWDVVFLPGLVEGTLPIIYARTAEAVEEERRLLYVGITRARRRLFLSWALARAAGGRRTRKPSRFLDGLRGPGRGGAPVRSGRATRPGDPDGLKTAPGSRRRHADAADLDEPAKKRFDRLREWRRATARDLSVPAYVVFSDATLEAIARRAPRTRADLATVTGVGAVKLDRYGAAVLELCGENDARS